MKIYRSPHHNMFWILITKIALSAVPAFNSNIWVSLNPDVEFYHFHCTEKQVFFALVSAPQIKVLQSESKTGYEELKI